MASMSNGYLRIGELSRRTGVSPELLRAWERRYGLFEPDRSPGRFRLYSDADLAKVRSMQSHLAHGLSAAEAARIVLSSPLHEASAAAVPGPAIAEPMRELQASLLAFDESGAHAALDRLLASLTVESFLEQIVLPVLRELGDGWERREVTIAQEHFASNLLRGRLLALGRGWGGGFGPRALLAAPPGDQHDLGLVVLGLALRDRGWRVTFLGADTPIETIADTARRISPQAIVLGLLVSVRSRELVDAIRALAEGWRVVISGPGASGELASTVGAEYFAAGPIEAAEHLSEALAPAVG